MGEHGDRKGAPLLYPLCCFYAYSSGGPCARHATTGRSPCFFGSASFFCSERVWVSMAPARERHYHPRYDASTRIGVAGDEPPQTKKDPHPAFLGENQEKATTPMGIKKKKLWC
jgi:hypothetical protein